MLLLSCPNEKKSPNTGLHTWEPITRIYKRAIGSAGAALTMAKVEDFLRDSFIYHFGSFIPFVIISLNFKKYQLFRVTIFQKFAILTISSKFNVKS
jgi:hypothetical protein